MLASLRNMNKSVATVSGVALTMLALVLYVPWLAEMFRFAPLSLLHLAASFAVALLGVGWFGVVQRLKWFH